MDTCPNCPDMIEKITKALERIDADREKLEVGDKRFESLEKTIDELKDTFKKGVVGVCFSIFVVIGSIVLAPKRISSVLAILFKLFK